MGVESSSRGLVGDTVFAVLPNVEPKHTFAITILLQAVSRVLKTSNLSFLFSHAYAVFPG